MDWWKQLTALWWPGEKELLPTNPKVESCYRHKYLVAELIKPKRICEIGVRAGYSAFAFLSACPKAEFIGLDNNSNRHGGVEGVFVTHAPKVLEKFNTKLIVFDSQKAKNLYGKPYDFIHVDGDHSYDGCLHDLNISHKTCEWILVDDYDLIPKVRAATDVFISYHPEYTVEYIPEQYGRGSMLIHTTFRR